MSIMNNQNNPRPILVYIGIGETREKNIAGLKRLARKFTEPTGRSKDGNISALMQKIAKGELIIIDPNEYRRSQADPPATS